MIAGICFWGGVPEGIAEEIGEGGKGGEPDYFWLCRHLSAGLVSSVGFGLQDDHGQLLVQVVMPAFEKGFLVVQFDAFDVTIQEQHID